MSYLRRSTPSIHRQIRSIFGASSSFIATSVTTTGDDFSNSSFIDDIFFYFFTTSLFKFWLMTETANSAYLDILERASTSGQAFAQCVFDHLDMMSSDPLEAGQAMSEVH
ncbi:hypothetical protein L1987_32113 [Smallanthus sonchifolius]|uniref:Uncharacterized protein n=1 Tax=Smallanthus sonchifolius TaxID=185202 RepID=A0ACB9I7A7_9ASTR|nr:hypothetical protein L1987_32113 [Smallanthus sonchifolius]